MLDANGIIKALGGRAAVAERFGASRTATYNWQHDGIPSKHWADIVAVAEKEGLKGVTLEALKATRRAAGHSPSTPAHPATAAA